MSEESQSTRRGGVLVVPELTLEMINSMGDGIVAETLRGILEDDRDITASWGSGGLK